MLRAFSIIEGGEVHILARRSYAGHFVNGAAAYPPDNFKSTTLHDFYEYWPRMFNNKTNGITHRIKLGLMGADTLNFVSVYRII